MTLRAIKPITRHWRTLAFCWLFLLGACAAAWAGTDSQPTIGSEREFWVWDLNVMPPGFRRATATLRASGPRSMVYVENAFWKKQIEPAYVERLTKLLEQASPIGAVRSEMGVVPYEESVFGPLPKRASGDDRLIVLFANLGKYKDHEFDGFFNAYDQMTEAEAVKEEQHSNEANIIYLNGLRQNETYTNGVIAHELQHLLAHDPSGATQKDSWLSESIAEGAMLLTGHFSDQLHVNRFARNTGTSPLVSPTYVTYGPQMLFASFLLDFANSGALNLAELGRVPLHGRDAIESFFARRLGVPQTFDAIYSNFLSYVFNAQSFNWSLPLSWQRSTGFGISMPEITAYKTVQSFPSVSEGYVYPYAFVAIDLGEPIRESTVIKVEPIRPANDDNIGPSAGCARAASLLWKPVSRNRIAVYAVGCEAKSKADLVHFRLIITDQASPKALPERTLLP